MRKTFLLITFLCVACAPSVEQREVVCEEQVVPRVCQALEDSEDAEVDADLCEEYVAEADFCARGADESLRLDECAGELATIEGAVQLSREELPATCEGIVTSIEKIIEGDYDEFAYTNDGGT